MTKPRFQFNLSVVLGSSILLTVAVAPAMMLCAGWLEAAPLVRELRRDGGEARSAGFVFVRTSSSIEQVELAGSRFDDDYLENLAPWLAGLPRLRCVKLMNTRITDEGLSHLDGLPALKVVYVESEVITDQGLEVLRAAHPEAEILLTRP